MKYIVSLSGGTASAVAADRAIERYGRDAVELWFANTLWEDEDLHRFMSDCMARWKGALITHYKGRTPLQVASERQIIPNSLIAPCTVELKIEPFRAYLEGHPERLTILTGLDWREPHRIERFRLRYEGYKCDFPLLWKPYEAMSYSDVVRTWGIEPPRLYAMGFTHNNCGGRCVKQGVRDWRRLHAKFPERFEEVRQWENEQRAKGGARAAYAIASREVAGKKVSLTMDEIAAMPPLVADEVNQDDMFSCVCSV